MTVREVRIIPAKVLGVAALAICAAMLCSVQLGCKKAQEEVAQPVVQRSQTGAEQSTSAVSAQPAKQQPQVQPSEPAKQPVPSSADELQQQSVLPTHSLPSVQSQASTNRAEQARKILEQMVSAYKQAERYSDAGVVLITAEVQAQRVPVAQFEYVTAFESTNKLRLVAYKGGIVIDGEKLWAYSIDIPNRVIQRPAPDNLSVESLFFDMAVTRALTEGPTIQFSWLPLPLLLRLAQDPLKTLLYQAGAIELLEPAPIDGKICQRVAISRPDGTMVLWIDQQSYVLRRVEFPSATLAQQFPPEQGRNPLVIAELVNASFEKLIDPRAFQFQVPPEAKIVDKLLPPGYELLGKKPPAFTVNDLTGKKISLDSLQGKIAVIEAWATWCEPCRQTLPLLQKLYEKYKSDERLAFYAISIDEQTVMDAQLQQFFAQLKVDIPIARDLDGSFRSAFDLRGVPTTVVLDGEGRLQLYQMGGTTNMDVMLDGAIEQLLSGENIAELSIKNYELQVRRFQESLQACIEDDLYILPLMRRQFELPKTELAERSPPERIKATQFFTTSEVAEPGNFLVFSDGQKTRIFVVSGGMKAVELSEEGKRIGEYSLSDDPARPLHYLCTALDGKEQRYFAANAARGAQLRLYDAQFKTLLDFPPNVEKYPHPGIADVRLVDINADGQLELLVGYWGPVGVQCVSLDGRRLWANRGVTDALRLAVYKENNKPKFVLSVNSQGGVLGVITKLDLEGHRLDDVELPKMSAVWVAAGDINDDGTSEVAALGLGEQWTQQVVGLTADGAILWQRELPPGIHEFPIVPLQPFVDPKTKRGGWLVVSVDGVLHFLDGNGRLIDRFAFGDKIQGAAIAQIGGKAVLLVSAKDRIEAWALEFPENK